MFPLRTLAPSGTPPVRVVSSNRTGAALIVESLGQRFGSISALDEVSLTVKVGEVVCVLGASGSGKSTLLRLIAGVSCPTGGRVFLNGVEVADDFIAQAIGEPIAVGILGEVLEG